MRPFIYYTLVVCRFYLAFSPGYLHPDEYMQSVEISAGEFFNLDHYRAWEFNQTSDSSSRIRSVIGVHLVSSLVFGPLQLLNKLSLVDLDQLSGDLFSAIILFGPRLVQCALSLVVDYAVLKLTRRCFPTSNTYEVLIWTSSSYVSLVYLNRTFSNSLECVLFMVFLLCAFAFVQDCRAEAKAYVANGSNHSKRLITYRNLHIAAVAFCIAIFVRPTFVLFALIPGISLILRGLLIALRIRPLLNTVYNAALVLFSFLLTFGTCVLLDSVYYSTSGALSIGDRLYQVLQEPSARLIITPLNFARYNSDSANLALHGTHAKWTHAVVNLPLLLGPAYLLLVVALLRRNSSERSELRVLRDTVLLTVAIFSVFSHQEARFLIALVPLCMLLTFEELRQLKRRSVRNFLLLLWLGFNVFAIGFYSHAHQAGIVRLSADFSSLMKLQRSNTDTLNVYFVRTYPIIRSALHAQIKPFAKSNRVSVEVAWLSRISQLSARPRDARHDVLVVLPAMCETELRNTVSRSSRVEYLATSAPHVTLDEDVDVQKIENYSFLRLAVFRLRHTV